VLGARRDTARTLEWRRGQEIQVMPDLSIRNPSMTAAGLITVEAFGVEMVSSRLASRHGAFVC
jgi:hypothetical protein